ncbi:MAG: hypothetical protein D6820_03160, partial [Lentisphaerae bacterium]
AKDASFENRHRFHRGTQILFFICDHRCNLWPGLHLRDGARRAPWTTPSKMATDSTDLHRFFFL